MNNPITSWAKSLYNEVEDISNSVYSKKELQKHQFSSIACLIPSLFVGVVSGYLTYTNLFEGNFVTATLYNALGICSIGPIVGYGKKFVESTKQLSSLDDLVE